jgi:hypothetical protein
MDDKTPGKRICIIRNAESKTNASMIRMMDALLESGYSCSLLTRTRYTDKNGITEKTHLHKNTAVPNAEIALKQEDGRGLGNIFQLLRYQWTVFIWLLKNHAQFDCMHAFDLDAGLPVRFAAALRKKKYVYHIADFYVDSRGGIPGPLRSVIKHMEFGVIHHAEATIVCTEERKKQIAGSRPKELIVIHNTPSLSPEKMGVCLDTCHIHEAGYDIVKDLDGVLDAFDRIIGLDKLFAIHLNDSKNPKGAKKDHHEKIGEGTLGLSTIEKIINHEKMQSLPFYLETPNEPEGYAEEIALLRGLRNTLQTDK